jgi:hypothetical protein
MAFKMKAVMVPCRILNYLLDEMGTISKLGTLIVSACHQLTPNITFAEFRNHWIVLILYREWNITVT